MLEFHVNNSTGVYLSTKYIHVYVKSNKYFTGYISYTHTFTDINTIMFNASIHLK